MNNEIFNKPKLKPVRQKLRSNSSKIESILWKKLKSKQLEYKFRRQQGIGKYIVDFYCPELKLIIELDGRSHDGEQFYKDLMRDKYLKDLGLYIIRYTSDQVLRDIQSVVIDIERVTKEIREFK